MIRLTFFVSIVAVVLVAGAGCSANERNPLLPEENVTDMSLPVYEVDETQINRELVGTWTVQFDPENQEISVTGLRNLEFHENVLYRIPNPVITFNSYDPVSEVFDVDVTLIHPCAADAYDVRLILFTDEQGHMLLNDDDWTSLYDIDGGQSINPFKAYAKSEPDRIFAGWSQHTENLLVYYPEDSGFVMIAVDASRPGNCEEPYSIENFEQEILLDIEGASAEVRVDVLDWQDDVEQVFLYFPLITDEVLTPFSYIGASTWVLELVNNTGANAGEYPGWILAVNSIFSPLSLYEDVVITIDEAVVEGWAVNWGLSNVNDVAVDSMGNIYVAGGFTGTTDFDPGPDWELRTSNGQDDAFVCKYDPSGKFEWVNTWGGDNYDRANAVLVDNNDIIYVAGTFAGTVDFDPRSGVLERTSVSMFDMFASRFLPNGDLLCNRVTGGLDNDTVYEMVLGNAGDIYLVGNFEGTCDFDPGPGVEELTSAHHDSFIARYTLTGTFYWVRSWSGDNLQHCTDAVINNNGDIYICGYFHGTVDFDPGSGSDERTSNGESDVFLTRFDVNGNYHSVKTWGGFGNDYGDSVALNSSGDLLAGGSFEYWVDFDPGPGEAIGNSNGSYDIFLSKFNSSDEFQWAFTIGSTSQDILNDMHIDSTDNLYLTGSYHYIVDFDPGFGVSNHTSNGLKDAFLAKYDSNGYYQWSQSWGATRQDYGEAVITDPSDYPILTGQFNDLVDFDPGPGIYELSSYYSNDAFLTKLKPNGYWY